jgi:hypothetical protein
MIVSLCAFAQRNTSQIRKLQDIKKGQATLPIQRPSACLKGANSSDSERLELGESVAVQG